MMYSQPASQITLQQPYPSTVDSSIAKSPVVRPSLAKLRIVESILEKSYSRFQRGAVFPGRGNPKISQPKGLVGTLFVFSFLGIPAEDLGRKFGQSLSKLLQKHLNLVGPKEGFPSYVDANLSYIVARTLGQVGMNKDDLRELKTADQWGRFYLGVAALADAFEVFENGSNKLSISELHFCIEKLKQNIVEGKGPASGFLPTISGVTSWQSYVANPALTDRLVSTLHGRGMSDVAIDKLFENVSQKNVEPLVRKVAALLPNGIELQKKLGIHSQIGDFQGEGHVESAWVMFRKRTAVRERQPATCTMSYSIKPVIPNLGPTEEAMLDAINYIARSSQVEIKVRNSTGESAEVLVETASSKTLKGNRFSIEMLGSVETSVTVASEEELIASGTCNSGLQPAKARKSFVLPFVPHVDSAIGNQVRLRSLYGER
jgi:hypothetical protein